MTTADRSSRRDASQALNARIRTLSRPLGPEPTHVVPRLVPLGEVRAVVWDIYGTLLVSGAGDVGTTVASADRADALREALDSGGGQGDLAAAVVRGVELLAATIADERAAASAPGVERPEVEIRTVWRRVIAQLETEGQLATTAIDIERLAIEYECRVNPAWPMPGAREVLAELRRRGLLLGIVSNAQFYTPLVLEALFGEPLAGLGFEPCLCVWSYELRAAKPSGELFVKLADELRGVGGPTLANVLFVGNDMLNDVQGAASAGCRTALFAGDGRSLRRRDEEKRVTARPDLVVTRLEQLLDVIGSEE